MNSSRTKFSRKADVSDASLKRDGLSRGNAHLRDLLGGGWSGSCGCFAGGKRLPELSVPLRFYGAVLISGTGGCSSNTAMSPSSSWVPQVKTPSSRSSINVTGLIIMVPGRWPTLAT